MSTWRTVLQVWTPFADGDSVETPSFTFRLERVRTLREQAEDRAREELAAELRARIAVEAMLRQATEAVATARAAGRDAATGGQRVSAMSLVQSQAYLERIEQARVEASLDLDAKDAEVAARRDALAAAARDRQAIEKLEERQRAEHDAEWARRNQNQLDELALAVHRRGGAIAA
jgi:flagellar FliJ protein